MPWKPTARRLCSLFALGMLALGCGELREESPQPASAGSDPAAETEMLGGGRATLVHPGTGGSPHVKVDWIVAGANVSITYGRPYLKGRVVGDNLEPLEGSVWRLGADESTTLTTDRDLMVGDAHVPAGTYTLYALDTGETWQLIVNKQTGQWGTDYDSSQDLSRTAMTMTESSTPVEQLTLSIADGSFRIEWGPVVAAAPIMVH